MNLSIQHTVTGVNKMNDHNAMVNERNAANFAAIKNAVAWWVKRKYAFSGFDVADLTQEAFAYVWVKIGEYNPTLGSLSTFAIRGARNAVTSVIRTRKLQTVQMSDNVDVMDKSDEYTDPDTVVSFVREMVSSLTGKERQVIELRLTDKTFGEIAGVIGTTRQGAEYLYHKAIGELREMM